MTFNTQGNALCLLCFWFFICTKYVQFGKEIAIMLSLTFLCMFEIRVFLWQGLKVEDVNVPVIGGHSGVTILPLLSQVGC